MSVQTKKPTAVLDVPEVVSAQHKRYWIYFLLFCLGMINYIDRIVISVNAQPISKEFGLSTVQLGYLFSSYLWTYALCQIPAGIIIDRWNSRGPLAIGVAIWSGATILTGAMTSFSGLLLTRLGLGMGEATALPGSATTTRQWSPVGERGLAFAAPSSGGYFGPAIGSLFVAWLTGQWGWRAAFYITGTLGFVWVATWLIWYRRPEDAKWLSAEEREKIVANRKGDVVPEQRRLMTQYGTLLTSLSMWGVMLTVGGCVYTQYLFLSWLPSYLQTTRHLSMMNTGVFASIPFAVAFVLSLCMGKISDQVLDAEKLRSGKRRVVIAGLIVCAVPILLIPYIDSLWLILLIVSLSLAGVASAVSQTTALLAELLRDLRSQAKAQSLLVIGGNIFGMIAPIVTGYVISTSKDFALGFVIAGAFLVLSATCVMATTHKPIG